MWTSEIKKKIFYLCIYVSIKSNQLHIYFEKKKNVIKSAEVNLSITTYSRSQNEHIDQIVTICRIQIITASQAKLGWLSPDFQNFEGISWKGDALRT